MFPTLIVAFGVIMGGYALTNAAADNNAALVLLWAGRACLVLVVINLILLVGALGLNAVAQQSSDADDTSESS